MTNTLPMGYSCCICGLILASYQYSLPQWCKVIRAVCRVNGQTGYNICLSGNGSVNEEDVMPFRLLMSSGDYGEFCYRSGPVHLDQVLDYCYPFHEACWELLQEINCGEISNDGIRALFSIFESFHYDENGCCLKWGHGYFFEDILGPGYEEDIYRSKAHKSILQDPSCFALDKNTLLKPPEIFPERCLITSDQAQCPSALSCLLPEVLQSILCYLNFNDAQSLLFADTSLYRQYSGGRILPRPFWQSIFSGDGEAAFATSIFLASDYEYAKPTFQCLESFLVVRSALAKDPNRRRLHNRKRIWKIGLALIAMVRSVGKRGPIPCGSTIEPLSSPNHIWGATACSLALGGDGEGCRELKQVYVPFDTIGPGSQLCAVLPTYTLVLSRRLISGITFVFNDGTSINAGYVGQGATVHSRPGVHDSLGASSNFLWLVFSHFGLEAVSFNTPPELVKKHSVSCKRERLGITRWRCDSINRICLGLDAMRIVKICAEIPKDQPQDILGNILWDPPYPISTPVLHQADVTVLHELQKQSFVPASIIRIEPDNGRLTAIHVYSQLAFRAGINGMRFVYDNGRDTLWGNASNTASLSFFISEAEILVRVTVYKDDSLVQHVQFTTNTRTSNPMPLLLPRQRFLHVDYTASSGGYITGFCGCFDSSQRLYCFGVLATPSVHVNAIELRPEPDLCEVFNLRSGIGDIQSHGEHRSEISLDEKYLSIRACINPTSTYYRSEGSVIGLLLLPRYPGHPTLLGQWTDTGETYDLNEGEQILDLEVLTTRPRCEMDCRPSSSQVTSIFITTSTRTICLGQGTAETMVSKERALRVAWHFNAIFDHVKVYY